MIDKFGIDNIILDTKNYNEAIKNGRSPYLKNKAIICSYNFVARKKDEILMHGFDISIIDEAHKLRNVYRQSSKTSHAVRDALTTTKKLLLTATPFQNSLLELYGLTSIIDDHILVARNHLEVNTVLEKIMPTFVHDCLRCINVH